MVFVDGKKIIYIFFSVNILLLNSCNNVKQVDNAEQDSIAIKDTTVDTTTANGETLSTAFDISELPLSDHDLGPFPYFKLSIGYTYTAPKSNCHGEGCILDFDREYFLVDGVYYLSYAE